MYAFTYYRLMALRLRKDKSGAVATEYAFLIAFIAIVAAAGMGVLGVELDAFFDQIGAALGEVEIPDLNVGS